MATEKICDVCGCVGAETVTISLNGASASGQPVGTSQAMDLCATHRAQGIATMNTIVLQDLEAAIAA